ncbi:lipoprotein [Qipengyuania sp. DGS5-3]|uniref:lipoprotein n=1 Tax=Qipengyuania sp. DGS5-3 TaxID=3349632 RepID=UPI0036D3777F
MRQAVATFVLAFAAAALSACGQKASLTPAPGAALPPEPYGAEVRPDAQTLLELRTQAAPERSVELRRRSEERQDDPFDLPPEGDDTSGITPDDTAPE